MRRSLSLILLLTGAVLSQAGVTFTAETNVVDEAQKQEMKTIVNAEIDGLNGRIEFIENNTNPMAKAGTYIITTDGGKTLYLVNPEDKTYMPWDLSAMMAMAGGVMNMMNIEFNNPVVEKLEESSGPTIMGYKTRRYKFRTSYDLSMKIIGIRQEQSVETVQESWTTMAFSDMAMGVWLRKEPPSMGNEGLDKVIADSMKTVQGFPLKSKTRTITKQYNRKRTKVKRESESISDMTVTKLEKKSIGADRFQIPSDYQKVEFLGGEGGEEGGRPKLKDLFKRNKDQ